MGALAPATRFTDSPSIYPTDHPNLAARDGTGRGEAWRGRRRPRASARLLWSPPAVNRSEWLGLMADPLLAQSAIDRLQPAAREFVLDGETYSQRKKPNVTAAPQRPP
jgi:hypothetical protein